MLRRRVPHTTHCDRRRRGLAFVGHAPALWLFYREALPRPMWLPNAVAVLATLVTVAAAWRTSPLAALGAFVIGHFAWGAFLAWRLPASTSARGALCTAACAPPF